MTKLKSMLLGTAGAAFVLASGSAAFAADPPAAGPVYKDRTPVWACDITGFWELPGTDICFKVGGYAKADFIVTLDNFDGAAENETSLGGGMFINEASGALLTNGDKVRIHAQQSRFNLDARSSTEYGVVRAFIEGDFWGGNFRLRHAFVQFGNLLAGQTWSTFSAGFAGADSLDFSGPAGGNFRQAQVRWTQSFGNGFSLAIALENPVSARVNATESPGLARDEVERFPDLVAALKVSQEWGTVQLSAVASELRSTETAFPGSNDSTFGWAVTLGGKFNLPIANGKDNFRFIAVYADGNSRYIGTGVSDLYDSTPGVAGGIETYESWGVTASLQHFWSDNLRSSLIGNFTDVTVPAVVSAVSPNIIENSYYAAVNLIWSPVPRVDMGLEVIYLKEETVGNAATPSISADGIRVQASLVRAF
jgi:hypothetical protein